MNKTTHDKKAEVFYADVLTHLNNTNIPFLVAGTFAFTAYTEITRPTKDIDLFCAAGDYPRILNALSEKGFTPEVTDDRWIVKAKHKPFFADIIFASITGQFKVDSSWFDHAREYPICGVPVKLVSPEDFIWSKVFRQGRERSDVADCMHVIYAQHDHVDWKLLLQRMEQDWEVLFSTLLMFRYIYPFKRNAVPEWLLTELADRLSHQLKLPPPIDKVSRGPLFSVHDYEVDITEWGLMGNYHKPYEKK